ncbi:hypothetical protein [Nocardia stercoris]|uniref:Uncharacterized protein n=1 Tax=Nocardia stercoris TaxID=2483361 RepID=A0A3M2KYJ1_9NOCA|nr:hypothetical protein [Nocardia stercoris]RMI29343.1 hypothetical protein EBN03_26840 [Nocardia stercoris]
MAAVLLALIALAVAGAGGYLLLRRPAGPWVRPPLYGAPDGPDRDRSRQLAELAAVAAHAERAVLP